MYKPEGIRLTRRDMLKLSAGGAGMFALTASGLEIPRASSDGGSVYVEAFPTSPLILNPFKDPLPIPNALAPIPKSVVDTWASPPGQTKQDSLAPAASSYYANRYGPMPGTHQLWPSTDPLVYQIKLQVGTHDFTTSKVLPIDSSGKPVKPQGVSLNADGSALLPKSTIYGFNGTFPGPMINAEYGKPTLVRFENHLDENPLNLPRQDFGAPNYAFLTHLHNGHTACESDGQPHYSYHRFTTFGDSKRADDIINKDLHYRAAFEPTEWLDNLYLNYPAGGDDKEKQSFLWFHDHTHGHTGANVYKGMVGLFPIYDPEQQKDMGDETKGYRLPGVRRNNPDGSFDVDYDIPLALYDCRLDDG